MKMLWNKEWVADVGPAFARVESLSEEATVREKRKNAKIADNGQITEGDFARKTRNCDHFRGIQRMTEL